MRQFKSFLAQQADLQRGHLFPWAPVVFAAGIGTYFALTVEPNRAVWAGVGLAMAGCLVAFRLSRDWGRPMALGLLLALSGFAIAGARAHWVSEVKLGFRYYGPIEGRIVQVDRSASDAVRLTLDRVVLRDLPPERTPARVRVALHGSQGYIAPEPGLTVILTGHLSPPGGAVEPGGYDFRRQAWFQRLGAVGYTRTPLLGLEPHDGQGWGLWLYRARMQISQAVQQALPGRTGAFAAAITTGDRSGMARDTFDALRASNLAHLLAISGLHMGLLTGFVFTAIRIGLALLRDFSLYLPAKKIAAAGALAAGSVYLALSGGNVATERAFIMVGVMFLAVLVDRRAVTLRAVAVAAMIVLTLRPEALYGPGFQMSFAATTALVAIYGAFRQNGLSPARWPRWLRVLGGVALSSLIAGMATAPIGAAHFNQVPHYGIVANVLSVPLMGAAIIPGAVLAAILAPFGLAWIGLRLIAPPIDWILAVADEVSSWEGSVSHVIAPGDAVLPLLAMGALWLVLWQGRGRSAGVPVTAWALVLWSMADRPEVLVSQSGGLIGVMQEGGRSLSKPRGDGFAATSWLENDGDGSEQSDAATRGGFQTEGRQRWVSLGGQVILHATGKTAAAIALADCLNVDLVILNVRANHPEGCRVYDLKALDETGALAIRRGPDGLLVKTVRQETGVRLWSP